MRNMNHVYAILSLWLMPPLNLQPKAKQIGFINAKGRRQKNSVDAGSAADTAAAFLAFVVSRVIRFWRVHWELHKKPNWKHVMLLLLLLLLSMLLLPLLLLQLMILLLLLLLLLFSAWSFSFWLWLWQSSAWLAHGASRLSYKNACRLADSRVVCIRLSAEQHIPSSKATLLHPTRLRTAVAFQSVSVDILRIDSAIKKKKTKCSNREIIANLIESFPPPLSD